MLKINAKSNQTAEIFIYGFIGDEWGGFTDIDFAEELKNLDKNTKELDIHINSNGGNVFHGVTIYNLIKNYPAKKNAIIDGAALSISSVIPLACDHIKMGEASTYMIHNPWIITGGDSEQLRSVASILDLERDNLVGIYSNKTGLSAEEIKKMMSADTWMNGKTALEHGFVDEIDEGLKVAAATNLPNQLASYYKNIPDGFSLEKEKTKTNLINVNAVIEQAERAGISWRENTAGKPKRKELETISAKMRCSLNKFKL